LEHSKYEFNSESPEELVFEYPELRFLHGLVRGPEGEPVSGATVRIDVAKPAADRSIRGPARRIEGTTNTQGRYVLRVYDDGPFNVGVFHPALKSETVRGYDPASGPLVFRLERGCRLKGTVTDSRSGQAISGATVSTRDPLGDRTTITASDGSFSLAGLECGRRVTLSISASGYGRADSSTRSPAAPEEVSAVSVRLDPNGKVTGRVVDEDGNAVADALVIARSAIADEAPGFGNGILVGRGRSSKDGSFVLESVVAGPRLWIVVEREPFVSTSSDVFSLAPGESVTRADLVLVRGGAIAGRVSDATGKPVPSVNVFVVKSSEARRVADKGEWILGPGTVTNSKGEFRIPSLEPDEYEVHVRVEGRGSEPKTGIVVRKGETTSVETIVLEGDK
ncbi:MAG TPA: carboxypeptidase-like regulatory domain-containing protein, partial [Planctomycetota bacterium]|nr:carboxypeptidase-like regulatory domain-containing protein [Planctomycetota bacterium]